MDAYDTKNEDVADKIIRQKEMVEKQNQFYAGINMGQRTIL